MSVKYFVLLSTVMVSVMADCYFPVEMQGEFMTQWRESKEIAYTSISLTYNSVPSWGLCHRRHRENVILRDTSARSGADCFRCIRIKQRSINVNQVHVRSLNKCFATEEEALLDCPTHQEVRERRVDEIMLYKTRGFYGESAVTQTHCPFSGRWKFSYSNVEDASGSCDSAASEAGGCPAEFMLDLKFRQCDFPDFDMSFQCLGNWVGEDGLQYLSLLDTKLPQLGEEPRPRYRCAVYETDLHTGMTHLALSNDSTCVNQLESHLSGYETLKLEREIAEVRRAEHKFPAWSQGDWDKVHVKGSELIYRSQEELTTYHADALLSPGAGKILARLRTACGELGYACIALEQRTQNILELKIGKIDSRLDVSLCSAENMASQPWITMGKLNQRIPCPLSGTFHGVIPDAENLCARSSTSCSRPDQMAYQVYNCENATEVYEDRLYQCYGQFEEGNLVYTYTQRLDLPRQECFVGSTMDSVEHYVMEAGAHCSRGKEPTINGMVMLKETDLICTHEPEVTSTERPVSPRFMSSTARTLVNHQEAKHKKHHGHNHRYQQHRPAHSNNNPAVPTTVHHKEAFPAQESGAAVATTPLLALLLLAAVLLHQ